MLYAKNSLRTISGLSTSHWIIIRKNGKKIRKKTQNSGLKYATTKDGIIRF